MCVPHDINVKGRYDALWFTHLGIEFKRSFQAQQGDVIHRSFLSRESHVKKIEGRLVEFIRRVLTVFSLIQGFWLGAFEIEINFYCFFAFISLKISNFSFNFCNQ